MIAADPSVLMWASLALTVVAIAAFAHPRIPLELTSVAIVATLLALFYIVPLEVGPDEEPLGIVGLLEGFANPAIIAVIALLVIGQGMVRTGALDVVSQGIYRVVRGRPAPAIALTMIVALVVSAGLNNTPVVVMLIPILAALADRLGHAASRVMMPLSFCTIMGGMTTLIGSSTNLLVSGTVIELGRRPLGFFDFTVPGAVLAGIGFLYVLFVVPRLIAQREPESETPAIGGRQFIAQFLVERTSSLVGVKAVGGMFPVLRNMTVLMVRRDGAVFRPPFEDIVLAPGDVVVVAATRSALIDAVSRTRGLQLTLGPEALGREADERHEEGAEDVKSPRRAHEELVAEVMISPGSRLIGLPFEQATFPSRDAVSVLGVQRRTRMTRARLNEVRLEAGDVLLVKGQRRDIQTLRANRDVVLMEWSASEVPAHQNAWRARIIFVAVVGVAAGGVLPITVTAVAGAALMVITGALNVRQAFRAIDRQIIMVGGAALALNAALTATGGASYVADGVVSIFEGGGAAVVLSAFFLLVAILTNVLSNNACAVLFTPIGVNIAYGLGVDPFIFIVAVVLAANCSFASPIGYVTNLLVMAPGRYQFADFVRAGAPLIILLWIGFSLFAPWYYGLW